jgi:hypothetical protein
MSFRGWLSGQARYRLSDISWILSYPCGSSGLTSAAAAINFRPLGSSVPCLPGSMRLGAIPVPGPNDQPAGGTRDASHLTVAVPNNGRQSVASVMWLKIPYPPRCRSVIIQRFGRGWEQERALVPRKNHRSCYVTSGPEPHRRLCGFGTTPETQKRIGLRVLHPRSAGRWVFVFGI